MSLESEIKENCPHCSVEQTLIFFNSVNVTLQPNLKIKVLNGKLNSQQCSNCKNEINIMSGFLYHDMENQLMINFKVAKGDDELSKSEILSDLKGKGYIYRSVNSYPELIEKIKIFDLNLNDIIIEKVKSNLLLILRSSLKEVIAEADNSEINIFFESIKRRFFVKKLSFVFFLNPSQLMEIDYGLNKLNKIERQQLFDLDSLRK